MYQMSKVSDAMSNEVSILDPDVLQGLGKGLELMSTAGIGVDSCDCYRYISVWNEVISGI